MTEPAEFDHDVAVSFAGEDRDFVQAVVQRLKDHSVGVFYDQDYRVDFWGEDLVEYFTDVYLRQSRYVVVFVSGPYAAKMWTNVERRAALARAASQRAAYLLPVRLDPTTLPGLLPTVGYLNGQDEGPRGIADAILRKIGADRIPEPAAYDGRVPRTHDQIRRLLELKPTLWEYWLYAGLLRLGIDSHEDKYRDFEIGYAPMTGERHTGEDAIQFLAAALDHASNMAEQFNAVLNADVQERAFGKPGEPGDADRIAHLANRLTDVYETFLDQAARVRGANLPSDFNRARKAATQFGSDPIEKIRTFVDDLVQEFDRLPERMETEGTVHLEMLVVIELSPDVTSEYIEGIKDARRSIRQ